MLDSLLSWTGEADSSMSASEAEPIGSDIETVEKQLANHEVKWVWLEFFCVLRFHCMWYKVWCALFGYSCHLKRRVES